MDVQTDPRGNLVRLHIDQGSYESRTPTTGAALYQLANVEAEGVLFKEVEGNREDTPVPRDGTDIHLNEDDHFHSARTSHSGVEIFVNTEPFKWERPKITYEEVVRLAYPDGPHGGGVRYNVMWTKPDGQEGALRPGQSVSVVNEMKFDVRNTDKS